MPTYAVPDAPLRRAGGVLGRRGAAWVLYTLCGSLALYPLLERFIVPLLGVSFLLSAGSVSLRLAARGFVVPQSFLWAVWGVYGTVYGVWFSVAMLHGNPIPYINQDSFGFLLYLSAMPVLFLHVHFNGLQTQFFRFIEGCSLAIAVASVLLVTGFFLLFGEINEESMALTNLFLRSLGLSWFIDHNHGLLGLYTNTAHLMLLGSALALHRFTAHHRRRDLWLVGLYLVAMALDGRRALVITAVLQLMVAAPRLMSALRPGQRLALVVGTAVVGSALVLGNLEWIEQRFSFTEEDISTAHRQAQIPPLLEKIAENPVFGGGFGTVASLLRSELRPFSYEVDFLATVMKLGVVGSMLYFGTYLAVLFHAYRRTGSRGIFYASAGLPFFFYMTTNGNQAMSTDSAVFHIFLFLLIAFSIVPRTPRIGPGARAAQGAAA